MSFSEIPNRENVELRFSPITILGESVWNRSVYAPRCFWAHCCAIYPVPKTRNTDSTPMTVFKKLAFFLRYSSFLICFARARVWADFLNRHSWFLLSVFVVNSRFFETIRGDYPRRLFEETIRGDYPKETIRRRLSEETIRRRLFEGVAHTIFFGVAHTIFFD